MTSRRVNPVKIEAVIENCRSEGKWQRVVELAEELKIGSPNSYECLANFLVGEGKLESYLEEHPPIESNHSQARIGLAESRSYLNTVTGENGRQAGIALDAHLLLAKLLYACGEYAESLENFVKAELNSLSEKELTLRSLKILAESYAIKGLCLESQERTSSSKFKQATKDAELITCFERAADLGLLYLQEQDAADTAPNANTALTLTTSSGSSVSGSTTTAGGAATASAAAAAASASTDSSGLRTMGAILETALQRAPIVLIKSGNLHGAIERYRSMLSAVESRTTSALRLTLARQLAEVLLRGVSGIIYEPPPPSVAAGSGKRPTSAGANKRLWQPRKYVSKNQFAPRNLPEETLLLLLIAETLAVRDAVLSQSPEFRAARCHSLGNAAAVYDLLTLATVRWGQAGLLHESFEKALKFSFGEPHIWRQYALCLAALGRHAHALRALEQSTKLAPADAVQCLVSARICYEHLDRVREGLAWSQRALEATATAASTAVTAGGTSEQPAVRSALRPATRAQLYVGIGYQQVAASAGLRSARDQYNRLALEALQAAVQLDPNDHLAAYYLALQYAQCAQVSEALHHVRVALALRAEHAASLHLFALLLTANRRAKEALLVAQDATEEFPENLLLLHVRAHLELHQQRDVEAALRTVQRMLAVWRELYEGQTGLEAQEAQERGSDTRSVFHGGMGGHSAQSDRDSNSVHAASLAASRVEQALSEAASSLSSFSPRPGPQSAWMIQLKIWLLLADIYVTIEQPHEAMFCVQEASQIHPLCHQLMYMRGQVHVYLGQWTEAKQCFLNAVSANPCHTDALRALGETHHILGEPRLAEKLIKDAARLDPNCPRVWFSLGRVLETLQDFTGAADCMATALQLEPSSPALPFNTIALTFE